jgi:hypothetical protein
MAVSGTHHTYVYALGCLNSADKVQTAKITIHTYILEVILVTTLESKVRTEKLMVVNEAKIFPAPYVYYRVHKSP